MKKNKHQESTYHIWEGYQNFIRQLHLTEKTKKPTGKQLTLKYLSKLVVIFFGSFLTTLTFYFLIDPNGIYNSGLNGLLQVASKSIITYGNINWSNYYLVYYGLGLLTNALIIFLLRFFFKAKLEIISTSIFYVLFQIIWTQLFGFFKLKEIIFNSFNPSSWQGLSTGSQLSFTLPYYIVIAIVSAIIHTYGYSLIFQTQATPGGLEIITSHFSYQKKRKFSVATFTKIFGFVIIFLVTFFNFFWMEDNPKMKKSLLLRKIEDKIETKEKKIEDTIKKWQEDMNKANKLEEKKDVFNSFMIRNKEQNQQLTQILRSETGEEKLEKYPEEIDYYFADKTEEKNLRKEEINKITQEINSRKLDKKTLKEKLKRKQILSKKILNLQKLDEQSIFWRYLSYISNNERLWATVVYVFLSSFVISQIFPRDRIVLLYLHVSQEEKRNKVLRMLAKFSPTYQTVYRKDNETEVPVYIINCYLSKWNYYLLLPRLSKMGKANISEVS